MEERRGIKRNKRGRRKRRKIKIKRDLEKKKVKRKRKREMKDRVIKKVKQKLAEMPRVKAKKKKGSGHSLAVDIAAKILVVDFEANISSILEPPIDPTPDVPATSASESPVTTSSGATGTS